MKLCTDEVGDYFHNVRSAMKNKFEKNSIYKMCKIVLEGEHPTGRDYAAFVLLTRLQMSGYG